MLLEIYAQSFDLTAIYSLYLTLLLSVSISAYWLITNKATIIENWFIKLKLQPSTSEIAYKNSAELGLKIHLLILKRIKIKVDPGDDTDFSSPA